MKISRQAYADMFGPTVGDRCGWPIPSLFIEVEKDFTTYGEEVKFGGGKVIRDGMGQSQVARADGAVDTVITNALIIDHGASSRPTSGSRTAASCAIGKAGNPDIQPGVTIIIGPAPRSSPARARSSPQAAWTRAYPLHLPAADRRSADERRHHHDRRRHRPGDRHQRDHLHPRPVAHGANDQAAEAFP
jgi:hypothetical protein